MSYARLFLFYSDNNFIISFKGYRLTRAHLEVKSSDRQDFGKCRTLLSLVTAAHFRQYFPIGKFKKNKANFVNVIMNFLFKLESTKVITYTEIMQHTAQ